MPEFFFNKAFKLNETHRCGGTAVSQEQARPPQHKNELHGPIAFQPSTPVAVAPKERVKATVPRLRWVLSAQSQRCTHDSEQLRAKRGIEEDWTGTGREVTGLTLLVKGLKRRWRSWSLQTWGCADRYAASHRLKVATPAHELRRAQK